MRDLSREIFDILDKTNIGVVIVDEQGNIIWWNKRYEKITQLSIASLVGKKIEEVTEVEKLNVMGEATLRSLVLQERQTVTRVVDFHTQKDVIVTTSPIFDAEGNIRWMIYVVLDLDEITELRKQLYTAFEESEAIRLQLQEATLGDLEKQGIVVRSKVMTDLYATALRIAHVDATLLILGETGTGKDKIAKFIHSAGERGKGNFVHVNCSAIPQALFESELFGYEAGAFTGAVKQGKMGLIELADGGTLFLDEVAELPLEMQAKMLMVLQEKELVRIGGIIPKAVDIRVIAATNRDLKTLVKEKEFREDLYYRLNVLEIHIPPLRERKDDIPAFINYFLSYFNRQHKQEKSMSKELLNIFLEYDWPGNVRELRHIVERLVIISNENVLDRRDLPKEMRKQQERQQDFLQALKEEEPKTAEIKKEEKIFALKEEGMTLKQLVEQTETQAIHEAIEQTANLLEAAQKLGIEVSTLTKKKQRYGIYKNQKRIME